MTPDVQQRFASAATMPFEADEVRPGNFRRHGVTLGLFG
jgi:hypothetical protein